MTQIPYEQWIPLSIQEVASTFTGAPFMWCLAGGYAVEQFLGVPIRAHEDADIVIFRDEQLRLQKWLEGWELYAADPPGTLRKWHAGEYLPYGIQDVWGYRPESRAWQLQVMITEVEGDEWFSRRHTALRGQRNTLIAEYHGLPCVRIDVQLMYKAKRRRPKDELDFQACLPRLSAEARKRLSESLLLLYPEGHPWLESLSTR
jgi:hypothetical protein